MDARHPGAAHARSAGDRCVGLLHPGQMGATVGAAAACNTRRVCFASEGRSAASCARAEAAGLVDLSSLERLLGECDLVLSVCPPEAALALAARVAALRFEGIYVDANAVSPETARRVQAAVTAGGARCVDGGLIGPPAHQRGGTRLVLSGEDAAAVAACFTLGPLEAVVLGGAVGRASALKLAFAGYTKGSAALLTSIYALACAEGVQDELVQLWERFAPQLPGLLRAGTANVAPKAWRFVGEMREIAAAFEAAGLPDGFHRAAESVYTRLADFKDADPPPELEAVVARLLAAAKSEAGSDPG